MQTKSRTSVSARARGRPKKEVEAPRKLRPLDEVRAKGIIAFVLEVKGNKVKVQYDDGTTCTLPAAECRLLDRADRRATGNPGGRPRKINKEAFGQITCILRNDTIAQLKEGAASTRFGNFLQEHLDKYPLPTRTEYIQERIWAENVARTAVKTAKAYVKELVGKAD